MTKNTSCYPRHVHNELRFRKPTVLHVERISAGFQRVVLGGGTLDGFTSHGFDDRIKVSFPEPGSNFVPPVATDEGIVRADGVRPLSCDYTPLYDEARHELAPNLYIHDGGVASMWAMNAREGDRLTIGRPRGSLVVSEDYAYRVYVCDESGMSTLRRHLEPLSRSVVCPRITVLVSVQDTAYQGYFAHLGGLTLQWFIGHNEQAVNEHLSWLSVPTDGHLVWVTGEGKVVRNLCAHFGAEAFDQQQVHAAVYWHQRR